MRIERSTGKMQLVEALTPLAGRLARDGGTSFYVEQQVGDQGAPGVACATFRPCRLVRADPSVFGSSERKLAARLTLQLPPAITPDQPLSLSGSLTTPVVRQGVLVRSEPVAGATLEGLQATDLNSANGESLRATGRTATTGADGTLVAHGPAAAARRRVLRRDHPHPPRRRAVAVPGVQDQRP